MRLSILPGPIYDGAGARRRRRRCPCEALPGVDSRRDARDDPADPRRSVRPVPAPGRCLSYGKRCPRLRNATAVAPPPDCRRASPRSAAAGLEPSAWLGFRKGPLAEKVRPDRAGTDGGDTDAGSDRPGGKRPRRIAQRSSQSGRHHGPASCSALWFEPREAQISGLQAQHSLLSRNEWPTLSYA